MRLILLLLITILTGCASIKEEYSNIKIVSGTEDSTNIEEYDGYSSIKVNLKSKIVKVNYDGYIERYYITDYHLITDSISKELIRINILCYENIIIKIEFGKSAVISTPSVDNYDLSEMTITFTN